MKAIHRLCALTYLLLATFPATAFFDPTIGRWASRDPVEGQACLAGGLYVFCKNSTARLFDYLGLWGSDVHHEATRAWARQAKMAWDAAERVGQQDNAVDSGLVTGPVFPWAHAQAYHFNRNLRGGEDSRLALKAYHLKEAMLHCTWDSLSARIPIQLMSFNDNPTEAVRHLGLALHPLQDWVAHGDYGMEEPGFVYGYHNGGSPQTDFGPEPGAYPDDASLDALHSSDGRPAGMALRHVFRHIDNGGGSTTAMSVTYAWYQRGGRRLKLTGDLTKEAISSFINHVRTKSKPCGECRKFFLQNDDSAQGS